MAGIERAARIHMEQDWASSGKGNRTVVNLDATDTTYYMKPHDTLVYAYSTADDGVAKVYLPPTALAEGKFYYIIAPTGAAGGDISLIILETDTELATNGDMDADGDYLLLYCDGVNWRTIVDGVA